MRIAHITDIHVQLRPGLSQLYNKRLLGSVNLYLLGRHAKFTLQVQRALVDAVAAQQPDVIACSGDLTAQPPPVECDAAPRRGARLLARPPTVLVAGNHDVYTRGAERDRRIEELFGAWTGAGPWPRKRLIGEDLAFVCLESCRAHLLSSGKVGPEQVARLDEMLGDADLTGRTVFVMLHYPLRDREGGPYGPATRNLADAREVEAVLARHAPRIAAILHGHEHHGFRTRLSGAHGSTAIYNPGASGYAWLPERGRRAHFCVYETSGAGLSVERFGYDGEAFRPEEGGAWATGG